MFSVKRADHKIEADINEESGLTTQSKDMENF